MNRNALLLVLALVFLEWLDFSLYLYLAKSVFAAEFFPPSDYNLMFSFALFAAAFLARPLGGWFFGRAADSQGRRTPLIWSAALMGTATLGIAMLPGYQLIGLSAGWGLLLLRIAQGLALGGELNNSAMFLVEHHAHKPLVTGSLVAASGALGMFVGGATAALLQMIHIHWLWRIVFLAAGVLSLAVCRARKRLLESPEFIPNHTPIRQVLKEEWQGIRNIALTGAFVAVTVYLCNAFWVSYAADRGIWSGAGCAWAGAIAQLLSALLAIPVARTVHPSRVILLMRSGMLTAVFMGPVLFYYTAQQSQIGVLLGLGAYIITNTLICASLYYFLYLQLPAQYRCRGVSTVWALAASIGAISLPLAEQAYLQGMQWLTPMWVSFVALASLLLLQPARLKPNSDQNRITMFSN